MVESILIYGIAGVIPFCIALWCICRQQKKHYKDTELNAPFIRDAESREDEARKQAASGAVKCPACGFENFMGAHHCGQCTERLGNPKNKSKTKIPAIVDPAARQQRVLRRKEWTRKTDVQGKTYWFRDSLNLSVAGQLLPGFVLSFIGQTTPATTTGLVTDQLRAEVQNLKCQYKEPSAADPLQFPIETPLVATTEVTELLTLTAQEFPQRYAELVRRAATLLAPLQRKMLRIKPRKPYAFEQSIEHLTCIPKTEVRSPLMINYESINALTDNTTAVDTHRDWLALVSKVLANAETGLFKCVNQVDQTYYINPHSQQELGDDHLNYFFATGRLLGRSLLQGDLLPVHLATPLLKILLGLPLSFHDLEHFDPVAYKNLKYLLETTNVESLSLDFSVQENGETIDLIANGRNIAVTNANKLEYLTRKTQYVLVESVAPQLYALCKGFYEVVPRELLLLVDAEELDYVLCGSDEIDVDEWQRESKSSQYIVNHPAEKYFWEITREMPIDYKRRLLHFATGMTRVPLGGFATLKSWDGRHAPFALHALNLWECKVIKTQPCVNRVDLPLYTNKKELKAVMYAILDPETYDLQA